MQSGLPQRFTALPRGGVFFGFYPKPSTSFRHAARCLARRAEQFQRALRIRHHVLMRRDDEDDIADDEWGATYGLWTPMALSTSFSMFSPETNIQTSSCLTQESGRQKDSKMTFRISSSQNRAGAIFWKAPRGQGPPKS